MKRTLSGVALAVLLCVVAASSTQPRPCDGERLHFWANLVGVGAIDCAHGGTGVQSIVGSVARAGRDSFVIDTRSPLADGSSEPNTFTVIAPGFSGFDRYMTTDALVRIVLEVRHDRHCAQRILIQSVSAWTGQASPVAAEFFFEGNDGILEPFAAAPFAIRQVKLDRTRFDVVTKGGGGPVLVRILTAPVSGAGEDANAWSYWIASTPGTD